MYEVFPNPRAFKCIVPFPDFSRPTFRCVGLLSHYHSVFPLSRTWHSFSPFASVFPLIAADWTTSLSVFPSSVWWSTNTLSVWVNLKHIGLTKEAAACTACTSDTKVFSLPPRFSFLTHEILKILPTRREPHFLCAASPLQTLNGPYLRRTKQHSATAVTALHFMWANEQSLKSTGCLTVLFIQTKDTCSDKVN